MDGYSKKTQNNFYNIIGFKYFFHVDIVAFLLVFIKKKGFWG